MKSIDIDLIVVYLCPGGFIQFIDRPSHINKNIQQLLLFYRPQYQWVQFTVKATSEIGFLILNTVIK